MQPLKIVTAAYDDTTITVYQAYGHAIADAAIRAGKFVPPFSYTRMTWIKPNFWWMMYRSGFASKPNQERVLAIRLHRWAFDELLSQAWLSAFEQSVHGTADAWRQGLESSPVGVQWDPARDARMVEHRDRRMIQIGIGAPLAQRYATEMIAEIRDVTAIAVRAKTVAIDSPANDEHDDPVSDAIRARLGM